MHGFGRLFNSLNDVVYLFSESGRPCKCHICSSWFAAQAPKTGQLSTKPTMIHSPLGPTKLMITNSPTGQLNKKTARKMPQNKHTIPAMSMSLKVMRPRKTMHLMTSHRLTHNHRPMNPHRNVHTLLYYKNALIMPVSLTITVKDCSIPKTREAIQLHSTSQEF